MQDLLLKLRSTNEFRLIMAEMKKKRPTVASYEPGKTKDEEEAVTNRLKFQSGMQKGFDLLFIALSGEKP